MTSVITFTLSIVTIAIKYDNLRFARNEITMSEGEVTVKNQRRFVIGIAMLALWISVVGFVVISEPGNSVSAHLKDNTTIGDAEAVQPLGKVTVSDDRDSQSIHPSECRDWVLERHERWGWIWITLQTEEGRSYRVREWGLKSVRYIKVYGPWYDC